jgi:aspartyl-tRNA(Asn)/glutamyl-tRNA(Gln) amidotransferase subunit B
VAGVTRGQRSKEESSDYRYFPDPDLVPVAVTPEEIENMRKSLGELPAQSRERLSSKGLSAYDTDVLVNQGKATVTYFFDALDVSGDVKRTVNWVTQDVRRTMNEHPELTIQSFPISSGTLGTLVAKNATGELPGPKAASVYQFLINTGVNNIDQAISSLGITDVDDATVDSICRQLISDNPRIVSDIMNGKVQAIGALIGQARKINPNVDPNRIKDRCMVLIHEAP